MYDAEEVSMNTPTVRVPKGQTRSRAFTTWWVGLIVFGLVCIAATGTLAAQAPPHKPETSSTPPTETPSATLTGTSTATPSATDPPAATALPSPTPTNTSLFSCCERNIRLQATNPNVRVLPHKNKVEDTKITVTLDFEVDLAWFCRERPDTPCRAYYEVSTGTQPWQERFGKEWKKIAWARVNETITTQEPLKKKCDGKDHKGTWTFTLQWVIDSASDVRNEDLRVRLRFPKGFEKKGTEYTIIMSVNADRTKPRPVVQILKINTLPPPKLE
jgi:hypothetical protein